jgi:hypothetical protein
VAAAVLATNEDANLRNGSRAVEYATRLCRITGNLDAMSLDVLAAAYAEAGQYARAAEEAQKAIDLANQMGRKDWADVMRARRELYLDNKPLRRKSQ